MAKSRKVLSVKETWDFSAKRLEVGKRFKVNSYATHHNGTNLGFGGFCEPNNPRDRERALGDFNRYSKPLQDEWIAEDSIPLNVWGLGRSATVALVKVLRFWGTGTVPYHTHWVEFEVLLIDEEALENYCGITLRSIVEGSK